MWILLFLSFDWIQARTVMSVDDAKRIDGYHEYQIEVKEINQQRQAGLGDFLNEVRNHEINREQALPAFLAEKKQVQSEMSDSSKFYKQWLSEVDEREQLREKARLSYLKQSRLSNSQFKKKVRVTEEQELGLSESINRVDWSKRRFAPGSSSPSGGGRANSYSPNARDTSMPFPGSAPLGEMDMESPAAAPPDYFESDPIPPPPPSEIFDPSSGGFFPPPVEDFAPPPVE